MEVIETLESYRIGKEKLINLRRSHTSISEFEVQEIIDQNRNSRERISSFVDHMLNKMREQIDGAH